MADPIVEIPTGKIRGTAKNGVYAFKGIPYGWPTGGKNRFLRAKPPAPWTGIRDAQEYGPKCPQTSMMPNADPNAKPILGIDGSRGESEDCLVLNIWTQGLRDGGKRPVMVWIHGGGYASGSGSGSMYDGVSLCNRGDVVIVTINHRLNVFGFLHLADILGEPYGNSGIVGMLDIVLALQWVRRHIGDFGGDPDNVTIFGESGGGRKVSVLLAMPEAKGLFHRAIIQSSPALRGREADSATDFAQRLLAHLGIGSDPAGMLPALPPQALLKAVSEMPIKSTGTDVASLVRLSPVVDGCHLPAHPFDPVAAPTVADVPILIGTNRDESSLFVAADPRRRRLEEPELMERLEVLLGNRRDRILGVYRTSRPEDSPWDLYVGITSEARRLGCIQLVERKLSVGRAPVYMYLFTWESDYLGYLFKAAHALDIPFVFDNVDSAAITGDRPDRHELAASVSEAWIAFARTGDPSHPEIPHWKPYTVPDRDTMILDVPCRATKDPAREERLAWEGMKIIP